MITYTVLNVLLYFSWSEVNTSSYEASVPRNDLKEPPQDMKEKHQRALNTSIDIMPFNLSWSSQATQLHLLHTLHSNAHEVHIAQSHAVAGGKLTEE